MNRQTIPIRETDLTRSVVDYLRALGFLAWRQNTGAAMLKGRGGNLQPVRFGFPGLSDVLAVLPGGRFLAVETKVGRNKATPEQAAFLAEVERQGGVGILAYCLDDVDARLKREGFVR